MNYSLMIPSVLILLVIMGYYFFRPRLPIRLNRAFLALLVIEICTELFECISTLLNETWMFHAPLLLWIMNLLFYTFHFTRAYMFFIFTVSIMDARSIRRSRLYGFVAFYLACIAVAAVTPFTGWLFRIDSGFHPGPLNWMIYGVSGCFLMFSLFTVLHNLRHLTTHEVISLTAMQGVLFIGAVVRFLVPNYIVMSTFCLMVIIILFISFVNPDLYLSDRGYVYNYPAFQAMLSECWRRNRHCRILGFTIQNYNEHREIFGGKQMDKALARISRWLPDAFPGLSAFYLRNGFFALVGQNRPDLNTLRDALSARFMEPWNTDSGELRLSISFVEADMETLNCPADRLINILMISQDELSRVSEPDSSRSLTDSIAEINRKLDIRRCLENALDQDALEVFLQPLIDCSTGRLIAAEALVRLRDDEGTLIRPDLFITMAEREGHIARLGEQVLAKVCRFIRDHDMAALGVRWINVNLSPVQFMSRNVPGRFTEILREYNVSEDMIHLEITEQSMIDFSLLRDQIMGLHDNGFQFSLDDYGSGYSNLSRVRQYPFTNIKIDMEVVRNYCRDRDLLLPAMVQAFKQMRLTVTAEGIETEEMANLLKEIGCDYLQGYYFSQPVPMPEFLALGL